MGQPMGQSASPEPRIIGVELRIATWNMERRRDAWEYLDALDVDIALVQEVVPPDGGRSASWQAVPAQSEPHLWRIDQGLIGRSQTVEGSAVHA